MDRRSVLLAGLAAAVASDAPAQAPIVGVVERRPPSPFEAAASFSAARGGASLVILRNGVRVLEEYPDGAPADARRQIGQATSCFIPALVGALVADRLMTLDEPVSRTFVEWSTHPWKNGITLRMLLDGTAGFVGGRAIAGAEARMLEPVAAPGSVFSDDPAALTVFLEIARTKLMLAGRVPDPALYVSERVLSPIGCGPIEWRRSVTGDVNLTDGAALSARSWAQLGELMRRVGVWRARELIAGSALRDACRGSLLQPRYGFGLWLAWPASPETASFARSDLWSARTPPPTDLVMAASMRGDRLFVLPTQRLVIARQSRDQGNSWSDSDFVRLLTRTV